MKFKVGDKARVKYVKSGGCHVWKAGVTVTVMHLFDLYPDIEQRGDCTVMLADGGLAFPNFDQLEPIIKKEDLSTWEAVQQLTNWNPSKVEVSHD